MKKAQWRPTKGVLGNPWAGQEQHVRENFIVSGPECLHALSKRDFFYYLTSVYAHSSSYAEWDVFLMARAAPIRFPKAAETWRVAFVCPPTIS